MDHGLESSDTRSATPDGAAAARARRETPRRRRCPGPPCCRCAARMPGAARSAGCCFPATASCAQTYFSSQAARCAI